MTESQGLTHIQKMAALGGTVLFATLYAYAALHSTTEEQPVTTTSSAASINPVPAVASSSQAQQLLPQPQVSMLVNSPQQSQQTAPVPSTTTTTLNEVLGGNLSEEQRQYIEEESPSMESESESAVMASASAGYFAIPEDPSDITYKPYMSNQNRIFNFPEHPLSGTREDLVGIRRPLNVLSIGGAHTSGETLDNKFDAFPYLIGHPFHNHVDVLASYIPSGADYPAMCLESISVRDHGSQAGPEGRAGYDLILLDFNLNGSDGLELLVKRLRHRYPDSIIVFVGLWSLLTSMEEANTHKTILDYGHDITKEWVWTESDFYVLGDFLKKGQDCTHEICTLQELKKLMDVYDVMVYEFPKPPSPKTCIEEGWFNEDDWHHLSPKGHQVLANGLVHFLDTHHHETLFNNFKTVQDWNSSSDNGGDQCYNWMSNGNIPLTYDGAEMIDLLAPRGLPDVHRWVLSFSGNDEEGGTVVVDSKFDIPVPAALAFFAKGDGSVPHVEVSVNNGNVMELNPVDYIAKETPYDKGFAKQMTYAPIGNVMPGKNIISIKPKYASSSANFELTGLYLCAACAQDGHLSF